MNCHEVPALAVTELWPLAEPLLRDPLKWNPFLTEAGLLQLLIADRAQMILFTAADRVQAVLVMEISEYPEYRVGNAMLLGGHKGVMKFMEQIVTSAEQWSRQRGCSMLSLTGRPGWSKLAKRLRGGSQLSLLAWEAL